MQYHPEAGPGPHDSRYLFDAFRQLLAPGSAPDSAGGAGLMPRRDDLESILLIGSGPIVIGQACEFDYSGTQACRVLRAEGYRVILANSNPATIMTDPDFADRTYVEPLDRGGAGQDHRARAARRPAGRRWAARPRSTWRWSWSSSASSGGDGGPELIGANAEAIATAEDRERFKQAMVEIGLQVPASGIAHTLAEAEAVAGELGLPVIVRPAYILGGRGTGIATTADELRRLAAAGLDASPISEILIERSIAGLEGVRARGHARPGRQLRDRLLDREPRPDGRAHRRLDHGGSGPDAVRRRVPADARRVVRLHPPRRAWRPAGPTCSSPSTRRPASMVIIEMNPRVSRSSALASKATGFPIAKIAARLAVGYTLDEIPNDITRKTPASFEPTIDYVVTKVPRWAFEKLPGTTGVLGTQMQTRRRGHGHRPHVPRELPEGPALARERSARAQLRPGGAGLRRARRRRAAAALRRADPRAAVRPGGGAAQGPHGGAGARRVDRIDPWFLDQILAIVEERAHLASTGFAAMSRRDWRRAKRLGFGDAQLAWLWAVTEAEVRAARLAAGVRATFKTVDTCAAEFEASTPYHYSTYEDADEVEPSDRPKVVILGSGPNRIGQGIEFDYCCVHASFALRDAGYETVMVNCNPETVSTDYDTSDRLYFEPLTREDVLNVIEAEQAAAPPALRPSA